MRDFLLRHGVPESKLIIENRSRSTDENVRYTAEILRQKAIRKIVLVTDAVHIRRAQRTFEKSGLTVIPAPCGFRPVYEFGWEDALPSWRAIMWNEVERECSSRSCGPHLVLGARMNLNLRKMCPPRLRGDERETLAMDAATEG
jgi:DUF218 domain